MTDKKAYYDSKTFKMEVYEKFRPPYSDKLYNLIYDQNSRGTNQWESAMDIGTGSGMVARQLSKRFTKVVGVDSNPNFIKEAQELSKDFKNVEFIAKKAEELTSAFPDNSFDLVVISEAAHWLADTAMEEIGRVLKPNGVMVMWIYAAPYFPDHVEATHCFLNIIPKQRRLLPYDERIDVITQKLVSGLDRVKIPDQYFAPGVRRFRVNYGHPISLPYITPEKIDLGVVILPTDVIEYIADDDFLTVTKPWDWIKGFIDNLVPMEHLNFHEIFKEEYAKLGELVDHGVISICWPMNITCATKKLISKTT